MSGPMLDLAAHDLAHPAPVFGCPWCPPNDSLCPLCGLMSPECPDPAGHRRIRVAGETSLLAGAR